MSEQITIDDYERLVDWAHDMALEYESYSRKGRYTAEKLGRIAVYEWRLIDSDEKYDAEVAYACLSGGNKHDRNSDFIRARFSIENGDGGLGIVISNDKLEEFTPHVLDLPLIEAFSLIPADTKGHEIRGKLS